MREHDFREIAAMSGFGLRFQMAEHFSAAYGHHPDVIAFTDDDEKAIAIGAVVQGRPNVGTCLFFATDEFPQIGPDVTRFVKQRLFPGYRSKGMHRIEAVSIAGYDTMHRWLGALGLEKEADLAGYGCRGEPFVQFSWVADRVRSSRARD
jgi:hypothetical protein